MQTEEAEELAHMLEAKGMTDKEIDDFLAHYGVKGMRWGQRRAGRKQTKPARKALAKKREAERKANRTPSQRRVERASTAINVGIGVATIAAYGAAFALNRAANNAERRTATLPRATISRGASFARSIPAIPLGPVGSTGIPRLNGAIPL